MKKYDAICVEGIEHYFFKVWLGLFDESLKQVFCNEVAVQILQRAQMIAERFQFMLYENRH